MRILRRKVFWSAASVAFCWLALCAAIGIFSAEGALHPARRHLQSADWTLAQGIAARDSANLNEATITVKDGSTLRAWSMTPAAPNGSAVILLHGQADNRAGMLGIADPLLRHGFAVLLPDARAHGESGGAIATYGVLEADDIRRWFNWVQTNDHPRCINGIGESMGGAELLNSLTVERGFCAVAAESVFSSFREAAYQRLGQAFHTGPWLGRTVLRPAVSSGILYARLKYGVDLARASPMNSAVASPTPLLLIHGLADTNMPPWHSEQIRLRDPAAELWEPKDAGHCGAFGSDPAEYEKRVIGWFDSHDPPSEPAASTAVSPPNQ